MAVDLALADTIQYVQLPMVNHDGQVELKDWPMQLPHVLAKASGFWRSIFVFFFFNRCVRQSA